jgi:hypothetical protein
MQPTAHTAVASAKLTDVSVMALCWLAAVMYRRMAGRWSALRGGSNISRISDKGWEALAAALRGQNSLQGSRRMG